MSLNFFKADCQYQPITSAIFGLCDNQDDTKAFPDTDVANQESQWIAIVKNEKKFSVVFTAIDKCVLQNNEEVGKGRCDGMLTTCNHLYLVELKNQKEDWQTDAKNQLLSTIDLLIANHDITRYKKKKAFACNKRRKKFAEIDNEENLILYRKTGFRIDIQAEIVVI